MFSNSILEMGVDTTGGETLTAVVAGLLKSVVIEVSIVAMLVLDVDAVLGGECLKCAFDS